jgi:ketosteroid isomerase-like protein
MQGDLLTAAVLAADATFAHAGDHPQPWTLRCTQVYRRADGVWKVVPRKSRLTWRPGNTWAQSRSGMTGDQTNHVQTFRLRY